APNPNATPAKHMIVFLNGQFVLEEQALVSVLDRGFLYGDGVFETLRIFRSQPFRWAEHIDRFQHGTAFLKIDLPFAPIELFAHAQRLIELNAMPESLLRITLTRGVGARGYSPKGANRPTLAMTLHTAPEPKPGPPPAWRVVTASCRLPANEALAEFKTCNKLPQILARAEADASGADEALLLNTDGNIVEASSSNLFWIANDSVCTSPLQSGVLAGVTRLVVSEICKKLSLTACEEVITPAGLRRAQGAFLSLSSWGIVEIASLDGHPLARSPLTAKIRAAYEDLVVCEIGASVGQRNL
ncbi:MAG TPA: aminotransferase class IV, partial [Verrucomicrobiae bacterium]|nr:aminotransferase class IV [Verrucomicrobiae bacterium]